MSTRDTEHIRKSFRALMLRAAPIIDSRGGRVPASAMEDLLRQVEPSFSPAAYGADKLTDLLALVPEVGHVEGIGPDAAFVLADATSLANTERPTTHLEGTLWTWLVGADPPQAAFVDLATSELVYVETGTHPIGNDDDRDRFLRVPALQQDLVHRWACEFADELTDATTVPDLSGNWFSQFLNALSPPNRSSWLRVHRQRVVDDWSDWTAQHELPQALGFSVRKRPTQRIQRPPSPRRFDHIAPSEIENIRRVVHQAVEQMNLDELLALPIRLGHVWRS